MNRNTLLVTPLASPPTETQALLSRTSPSGNQHSPLGVCLWRLSHRVYRLRYLCLPSKAAILILLWTAVVGAVNTTVIGAVVSEIDSNSLIKGVSISISDSLPYASLAVIMMFYPVSGFIADICCGRFRTVMLGLISVLISLLFASLISLVELLHKVGVLHPHSQVLYGSIPIITVSLAFFIIGLAGYQANYIQLGLQQLSEAPSEYLGLFVHWSMWVRYLISAIIGTLFVMCTCHQFRSTSLTVLYSSPVVYFVVLSALLVLSYWKRHWFFTEHGQANPYTTVIRVLNFARKHKYPLQRSAFTYCDDVRPSRIDFAKERFGGPFTTEQVEDVKTFLRIVIVLLSLGPTHVLQVPASALLFPLYGLHVGHYIEQVYRDCSGHKLLLQSGSLMSFSSVIFFLLYIWIIFSLLRNKIPRMFTRLKLGLVLFLLGIFSMLITDIVGHSLQKADFANDTLTSNCMFHFILDSNDTAHYPTLNMHWAVLIPPNILLGIGQLIFVTTTLEFISAQSPNSMKGLLVGVFFAIKGLFQFLSSIIIIPFSLKNVWNADHLLEHPAAISCGFGYLLFSCVVGLVGLVLFSVAAKKYKYRDRDEVTFRQIVVEEIYDRYISQAQGNY